MKKSVRNFDVFDDFADEEPIQLTIKKKKQALSEGDLEGRPWLSKRQNPRHFGKRRTREDQWKGWMV